MSLISLTLDESDLLVVGYTRENRSITVPIVLIKLFQKYYDNFLHWKLENEQFLKMNFESIGTGYYPQIDISNFTVESRKGKCSVCIAFELWPRGRHHMAPKCMYLAFKVYVSPDALPLNVLGYGIDYAISGNLMKEEIRKTENILVRDRYQSIDTSFSLLEFSKLKYKFIDLNYHFAISALKYNKMKSYCCWTQTFNKIQLKQSGLKINVNDFNNWSIKSSITRHGKGYGSYLTLNVCPAALPYRVKYLNVRYYAKCSRGGQTKSEIADCGRSYTGFRYSSFNVNMDYYSAFLDTKKLKITLSIQILKIFDILNKPIHKNDWAKYGFVKQ